MGAAARAKVVAEFDVDRNIDVLLANWRAIVRQPRRSGPNAGFWARLRAMLGR
jgi:hypothetical protein